MTASTTSYKLLYNMQNTFYIDNRKNIYIITNKDFFKTTSRLLEQILITTTYFV